MALGVQAHLGALVQKRSTIRIGVVSGHEICFRLTSAGADWVAGETGDPPGEPETVRGVVIPLASIAWIDGGTTTQGQDTGSRSTPQPLGAMLGNLASLRKRVTVFGAHSRWSGVIQEATEDYLVLGMSSGESVLVPYSAVSWISVA